MATNEKKEHIVKNTDNISFLFMAFFFELWHVFQDIFTRREKTVNIIVIPGRQYSV